MINLDFSTYVLDRTRDFTGREWVFKAINDWLADPDGSRFFLLIGEPGSGKTAISARLSQFSKGVLPPSELSHLTEGYLSAIYFCSAHDTTWIDPLVFAGSLATQLANRYPVYLKFLEDLQQEKQLGVNVQQTVQEVVNGQVIGVVINVSGPSPESAFNRVVREPLNALRDGGVTEQVVILVDALDEALSYSGTPTIVSLLAKTDNLPSRMRFILTSRLETDVLRPLRRSHPKELTLTSGQGLTQSLQDVHLYTQFALDRNPALEHKLAPGLSRQALINAIQEKSEGNFLYVSSLLTMLQEQQEQINLAQLETLPTGLDGIYLEFLERLVTYDIQSWENKYAPILGALAVAQIPLNEAQLSNLTGQIELSMTLKRLHQLLDQDETLPLSQRTYALYHRSFIDFLLDKDRSEEYGRDAKREHLQLAHWCEKDNMSIVWEDVKDSFGEQGRREYARKYYVTHLYLSQEWQQPQNQRLFAVLDTAQYGQAKIRDDPSTRSYSLDLDLGRQVAIWEGWTLETGIAMLPRLWQYTLLRCSFTSRANIYPLVAFGLLVLLKHKQKAVGLAELMTDQVNKTLTLIQIAGRLRERSSQETEWLEVLLRAEQVARMIEESDARAKALREVGTALAQAQQWERAEAVINRIEESHVRAEVLSELGMALAHAQQWERAEALWIKVEAAINGVKESYLRAKALSWLGTGLAQAQQWERAEAVWTEAEAVIDRIKHGNRTAEDNERSWALSELGTALAHAQQWDRAKALWTKAGIVIEARGAALDRINENYQQAEALSELGMALLQAQQWERAEALWTEAEAVINLSSRDYDRAWALSWLGTALAQAKQWERAEAVILKIDWFYEIARMLAFRELVINITRAGEYEQLLQLIQRSWMRAKTSIDAFQLFFMATWFIPQYPELGIASQNAFTWVDNFLDG